jgi:hypothetical protein
MNQPKLAISTLLAALSSNDQPSKIAAMKHSVGAPFPISVVISLMENSDWVKRCAAMLSCTGRDVPMEILEKGLRDKNERVRIAAVKSFIGKVPPSKQFIHMLLNDDSKVCNAITEVYKAYDPEKMPLIRTFEPTGPVYIRCIGGVAAEAIVPDDAQVRGFFDVQCRASKVIITDIIGKLFDTTVAIPRHDTSVVYEKKDIIICEDFEMGTVLSGKGIPFVCTLKEAQEGIPRLDGDLSPINPLGARYLRSRKGATVRVPRY